MINNDRFRRPWPPLAPGWRANPWAPSAWRFAPTRRDRPRFFPVAGPMQSINDVPAALRPGIDRLLSEAPTAASLGFALVFYAVPLGGANASAIEATLPYGGNTSLQQLAELIESKGMRVDRSGLGPHGGLIIAPGFLVRPFGASVGFEEVKGKFGGGGFLPNDPAYTNPLPADYVPLYPGAGRVVEGTWRAWSAEEQMAEIDRQYAARGLLHGPWHPGEGETVLGGLLTGLSNIARVGVSTVRVAAPYVRMVLYFVPGVGWTAGAILEASLALAEGESITDATLAGIRGALPPVGLERVAFDMGVALARNGDLTDAALATAKDEFASSNPLVRAALVAGAALESARQAQHPFGEPTGPRAPSGGGGGGGMQWGRGVQSWGEPGPAPRVVSSDPTTAAFQYLDAQPYEPDTADILAAYFKQHAS